MTTPTGAVTGASRLVALLAGALFLSACAAPETTHTDSGFDTRPFYDGTISSCLGGYLSASAMAAADVCAQRAYTGTSDAAEWNKASDLIVSCLQNEWDTVLGGTSTPLDRSGLADVTPARLRAVMADCMDDSIDEANEFELAQ